MHMKKDSLGKVFLVGAGPGDPGLLTIKGKECLRKADVVIYDFLANPSFLDHAPMEAERIYVGKKGGDHTMTQQEINGLMVQRARKGLTVIRLKGGDPFLFGRGGEEAQELHSAGVPFEVVPGVTSALSVPACAGIPLSHRDYASSVALVTGHEDSTKEESNIRWDRLSTGAGTLVFLMGVKNLASIAHNLMKYGRSPETPVAIIQRGTLPEQKTTTGLLGEIAEKALTEKVKPPAIVVVGEVVKLRDELNWFEKRPLFGRRIVVTRAREQASEFLAALCELGAQCVEFPTIEIIPPEDWSGLDRTIAALETYQWLLFTSVNGVKYFFRRLQTLGKDARDLKGIKIGAIGPKTAQAIQSRGIRPDLVPDEYRAEAVVLRFREMGFKAGKILLPRAASAREVLPEELKEMGFKVDVVDAYRTVRPDREKGRIREMLQCGQVHMVTFTSSSTVNNFVDMFREEGPEFLKWMKRVAVACIGPITARTAEESGLFVSLMPSEYTVEALTDAIVAHFLNES
jgi:uroporphyrinogen III methyltransferase/synthase